MTLELAIEGCCKGHPCDNCKTCQSGHCCRRDNPGYKLPKLGDWNNPIYGQIGVLNDDGGKVECHICGGWFVRLNPHIWRAHDTTSREYKSLFGLRLQMGLVSSAHHDHLSRMTAPHMADLGKIGNASPYSATRATKEQQSFWGKQASKSIHFSDRERIAKKRRTTTHCKWGHEYTSENTGRAKDNSRYCIACKHMAAKRGYEERKQRAEVANHPDPNQSKPKYILIRHYEPDDSLSAKALLRLIELSEGDNGPRPETVQFSAEWDEATERHKEITRLYNEALNNDPE